jgi:hypothetical protein
MSTICSTPPYVSVKAPETSAPKVQDVPKAADVKSSSAADEANAPQPAVLAPLPPGQGTRIDQLV